MKFASVGEIRYILPKTINMLPDAMTWGEVEDKDRPRNWPIKSYRSRPPLTQEQKEKIINGKCPKCDSLIRVEEVICGGEKGREGIVTIAAQDGIPITPLNLIAPRCFDHPKKDLPPGRKSLESLNVNTAGSCFMDWLPVTPAIAPGKSVTRMPEGLQTERLTGS